MSTFESPSPLPDGPSSSSSDCVRRWQLVLSAWRAAQCTLTKAAVALLTIGSIVGWVWALRQIGNEARREERATVESPRTPWSTERASQITQWNDWQRLLAEEAAAYTPASPYDARSRLVLLGDAITEAWRGTAYGEAHWRTEGVPAVLDETLAKRWPGPLVLGIAGDMTQHVLWRLSHGELSARMAQDPRLAVVLLVGSHNLAAGHDPEETAAGIEKVAGRLLNETRGKLLVNALLPRGDGAHVLHKLCPPRCAKNGKPFHSFGPAIERVNRLVNASVLRLAAQFRARVRFVDCGKPFTAESGAHSRAHSTRGLGKGRGGGGLAGVGERLVDDLARGAVDLEHTISGGGKAEEVQLELMPDRVHPNAAGHRLWAECLEQNLAGLERAAPPQLPSPDAQPGAGPAGGGGRGGGRGGKKR